MSRSPFRFIEASPVAGPWGGTRANLPLDVAGVGSPPWAGTIYRPYFTAAIITVLTAGATWGACLLARIARAGTFTGGISLQEVNAHGQAQVYGWVGLFVMGFACQAFPRKWNTTLAAPRVALVGLAAMVAGIAVRTIVMPLAGAWSGAAVTATAGAGLQLAAILLFAAQILATFHRSGQPFEPYVGFIFSALFWFAAMAALDLWHTYATMSAATTNALLWHVATYQAPLRDMQIHGLGLLMVLGVAMWTFPDMFRLPAVPVRPAWRALVLLNAAVIGECVLFVAYRWTGNHVLAAFLMVPWLLLPVGVATVVLPWRPWRPFPAIDRSGKFVRAAFGWLAISMLMLVLLPAYTKLAGVPFSHAYYGAIRHAITVGFLSLMILGVASKVVPALNGIAPATLSSLIGPFALLNLGCATRVGCQVLTDFVPQAYAVIGVSGVLEVTALAWWGIGLITLMRRRSRQAFERPQDASRGSAVTVLATRHACAVDACG